MGKGGIFKRIIELVLNTDWSNFGRLYDRGGLFRVALHTAYKWKEIYYLCLYCLSAYSRKYGTYTNLNKNGVLIMIWFLILIPIGLVVFGILYDIKNKSFKEIKAPPKGKSSDAAFRDANTHNNVNSSGGL